MNQSIHRLKIITKPWKIAAFLVAMFASPAFGQVPASGLKAHWKFDEAGGLTASDSTTNQNHGVLNNFAGDASQWITGKVGGAIAFNGANYVEVPDHASIGADLTNGFTVAAWFRSKIPLPAAGGTRTSRMLEKGDAYFFLQNPGTGGMNLLVKKNGANFTASLGDSLEADRWYHIAGTFDGTAIQLYLDGEPKGSTPVAAPLDDDHLPLRIGSDDAGAFFNGDMDEVLIYDRPLMLSEIQLLAGKEVTGPPLITRQPEPQTVIEGARVELSVAVEGQAPFSFQWRKDSQPLAGETNAMLVIQEVTRDQAGAYSVVVSNALGNATSAAAALIVNASDLNAGFKAHWKFDETSGLVASDSTTNQNHGALNNFPGNDSQWIPGKAGLGGAIAFNGANFVEVPDQASIGAELVNAFTVAAWFRPNAPLPATGGTRTSRMLEKGDAYFFLQNPGTGGMNFLVKKNNGNFTASLGESLAANVWYHIAGTFDGATIRVYLDGELKGSTPVAAPLDDDQLPLRIGSDDLSSFFNGAMDEVQIWSRPLNAVEIRNVMNPREPPVILAQPRSTTRFAGSTATFAVAVRGQQPLRFLWFKGDQEIRAGTDSVLVLEDVEPADSGMYRVRISNELGEVFSESATLTVLPVENINTGLAALWRFDETTGLMAADASGSNRVGQLVDFADASSHWKTGQVNGALQFDGQANRVVVADSSALNLGPEATFAFWINPAGYGTELPQGTFNSHEGRVLRKGTHFDVYVIDNPGGVRRTLIAGGVNAPQTSVELGVWQHFTVVVKAGLVRFYKNGFPIGEPRAGGLGGIDLENVVLGNFNETIDMPRFFNGLMDEVGIWARPLGETEILELAGKDVSGPPVIELQPAPATRLEGTSLEFFVVATGKRPVSYQWNHEGQPIPGATNSELALVNLQLADAGEYTVIVQNDLGQAVSAAARLAVEPLDDITSGLAAYWSFDETSGTVLSDSSGNNVGGALQNFSAVPGIAGPVGGAFDFDGVDDFIVVPHRDHLNLTDQGTISVWINPRTHAVVGGHGRIARKSVNYDLTLIDGAGGTLRVFGFNKTAYDAPNASVELNVWQHFAVTFRDGVIQYYKNGLPLGAPIPGLLGEVNTDNMIIGNFQADLEINRIFNGLMDELGIWSRALSVPDIEGIYQNGLLGKPLTATFEPLNIKSISVTNQVQITFFTPYPNRQYAVQTKAALDDPAWADQPGVQFTPAGASLIRAALPPPAGPAAFYRVVALAQPPLFQEDFESGAPGWTHGGAEDNWELGAPTTGPLRAHGGQNVYATGLSSNYRAFTDSYLRSPVIDLTGMTRATLVFWEWRSTDADPIFHGTVVNVLDADSRGVLEELSRTAGTTPDWQMRSLKLGSGSLGRRVVLEFRLYSDHTNLREGWFLDDLALRPD